MWLLCLRKCGSTLLTPRLSWAEAMPFPDAAESDRGFWRNICLKASRFICKLKLQMVGFTQVSPFCLAGLLLFHQVGLKYVLLWTSILFFQVRSWRSCRPLFNHSFMVGLNVKGPWRNLRLGSFGTPDHAEVVWLLRCSGHRSWVQKAWSFAEWTGVKWFSKSSFKGLGQIRAVQDTCWVAVLVCVSRVELL